MCDNFICPTSHLLNFPEIRHKYKKGLAIYLKYKLDAYFYNTLIV
jgi:hypothetical protein